MIAIQPTPQALPKGFKAPSTTQTMLEMVAKYTQYQISDDSQVMVVGPNTPAVTDQNRVWLRTDAYGRPVAFFLWYKSAAAGAVGAWRRVPTLRPAEIRMFTGNPATFFDVSGRGLTTAEWDGWALCNGGNGTIDLRDRFIVPATGPSNTLTRGGSATLTLLVGHMPRITATIGELYDFVRGGGRLGYSGLQWGGGAREDITVTASNTGLSVPISTLPPYIAVGFAEWVGYL